MVRRSGGRKARPALRSAPLAAEIKLVNPGEKGSQYCPLSDADVAAIKANAYRILIGDPAPHFERMCRR